MGVACGRFGMDIESFWNSSPADVYTFIRQAREVRHSDQKERYEIARWVSRFILTPHSKKPLKLQDLAHFPWEERQIAPPPSKEELAKWDWIDKKHGIPTIKSINEKRKKNQVVDLAKIARKKRHG